jgi:hypothetical protein
MRIIAIVTNLPPAIDGVGDYALHLARQLRQDHNIYTCFTHIFHPLKSSPNVLVQDVRTLTRHRSIDVIE